MNPDFVFGDVVKDPKTRKRYVFGELKLHDARTGAEYVPENPKALTKVGTIFGKLSKTLFAEEPARKSSIKRYAFNGYSSLAAKIQASVGCYHFSARLCERGAYVTKRGVAYKMIAEYEQNELLHQELIESYLAHDCFGYSQVFVFTTLAGVSKFASALRAEGGGVGPVVHEYTGRVKYQSIQREDREIWVTTVGMLNNYIMRQGRSGCSNTVFHWCNLFRSPLISAVRQAVGAKFVLYASKTESPFEIASLKHNIDAVTQELARGNR